ncbi:hypothetical protein BgAZ_101080 [Babesia gibsoni]|uniref:RNA-editing substrate-binding complex 6 protein domain-containing protein n=1 Tax=Babesia gibsoni TaxID=33632 RepID=A0AAD8PFB1_BABGI|nr:hypothetical protein BgAZ_101080 [Babesia gibsoni]
MQFARSTGVMKLPVPVYRNVRTGFLAVYCAGTRYINNGASRRHISVAKDFVLTPIHYQDPRELIKTVVKGGNYRLHNRNFWLRCASAVLYHMDCFSPGELLVIAKTFGKVRHHDPVLFKAIADLSLQQEPNWKLSSLPTLLHSFRSCSVFDRELFQKALYVISKNITRIPPADIALVLDSLTVTKEFIPDSSILDELVSPMFVNLTQFSLENIAMIVSALAHVNYKNDVLLRLVSHHVEGISDYSPSCYALLKAMVKLGYVDSNIVKIASGFVYENFQFMHVDRVPELLKLLLAIQTHSPIDSNVYKSIIRVVSREQTQENWKIMFGVNSELRRIKHSDTYLTEICNRIGEYIRSEFDTKQKIELLGSCMNYPLRLGDLYDAILSSFQTSKHDHGVYDALSDESVVSNEEHLNLMILFSKLQYLGGMMRCITSIKYNGRNITGAVAIKYFELISSHPYLKELLDNRKIVEGDRHSETNEKPAILPSDDTIDSWNYIKMKYHDAAPNEVALGICHSDTLEFLCLMAPQVIKGPTIVVEVIPAVLRRSAQLSSKASVVPQEVRDLHVVLCNQLCKDGSIDALSTASFVTLVRMLDKMACHSFNDILSHVNKSWIDRVNADVEDIDMRLLCNVSLPLLRACINNNAKDSISLAQRICAKAHHIDLDRVHLLLELLVEMGFKDEAHAGLLEPTVEKALTIDSDMLRVQSIDSIRIIIRMFN